MDRRKRWWLAILGLSVVGLILFLELPKDTNSLGEPLTLHQALAKGLISYHVFGEEALSEVKMRISNRTTDTLVIIVPAGTVFEPHEAGVQRMGVIETTRITLAPRATAEVIIPAACLDMELEQPSAGSGLTLSTSFEKALALLASSPKFQGATWRVKQFAVWTMLSRPETPDDFVGLGFGKEILKLLSLDLFASLIENPGLVFALPSNVLEQVINAFDAVKIPVIDVNELYWLFLTQGPTSGELEEVKEILLEAGFDLREFPLFRDR